MADSDAQLVEILHFLLLVFAAFKVDTLILMIASAWPGTSCQCHATQLADQLSTNCTQVVKLRAYSTLERVRLFTALLRGVSSPGDAGYWVARRTSTELLLR